MIGRFLILWVATGVLVPGAQAAGDGEALARQVFERPDGRDAVSRGRMVLEQSGSTARVREMVVYRQEGAGGRERSLVRFTLPVDIDGTGLLTMERGGGESDQWLYLPALGKVRRIASSRKGGRFVGSDIYYEDLRDREVAQDRHRLLGEGEAGGVSCRRLESVPMDSENSSYTRRVRCIDPVTLLAMRVEFYRDGDRPIKRLEAIRRERIQGYWTATETVIEDLDTGHRTRLYIDRIRYDTGLPESLFTRRMLEDPARERRYRP